MHFAKQQGVMSQAPALTPQQLANLLATLPTSVPESVRRSMLRQILHRHYSLDEKAQSALLGQAVWQHAQAQQRLNQLHTDQQRQLQALHDEAAQLQERLATWEQLYQQKRAALTESLTQLDRVFHFLSALVVPEEPEAPPATRHNPRILSARKMQAQKP